MRYNFNSNTWSLELFKTIVSPALNKYSMKGAPVLLEAAAILIKFNA